MGRGAVLRWQGLNVELALSIILIRFMLIDNR